MASLIRNRLCRFAVSMFVIVLGAGTLLLGPASTAGATGADPWIAGTYQANAPDIFIINSQPLVLFANRSAVFVGSPNASWFVEKGSKGHPRTVMITVSVPATPQFCGMGGVPFPCDFLIQANGPKTPEGIASQAAPGFAEVSVGNLLLQQSTFWAVRTGPAKTRT